MTRLRVASFGLSLDGYGAGPDQSLENPLGVGGEALHESGLIATRTFRSLYGQEGGTIGVDDRFAARGFENVGAWIMGRNMFGPVRGPWPDESWRGWWGENPPYHCPVFVLTHHARADLVMDLRPEPDGEIHLLPYLMQRLVVIAGALGKTPLGAWWRAPDRGLLATPQNTFAAAQRGRAIGFRGALCLRPEQVDALNRAYT